MFERIRSDVRYALRWLRRSPGFTLVAILSFAIGIGFNTAVFTLVDAILFRPLPVDRPDRLVDVFTSGTGTFRYSTSSYPDFQDIAQQNEAFAGMLAYSPAMAAVNLPDRSRLAMGEVVSGTYFQVLGLHAAIGRTLAPDDDRPGAPRALVISYGLWTREFANSPDAVGRTMRIHGEPYTIVGVAPAGFTGMLPVLAPEIWVPLAHVDDVEPGGIIDTVPSPTGSTKLDRRGYRWLFVKGRLRDGVSADAAAANLRLIGRRLAAANGQTNKDRELTAVPTSGVHVHPMADQTLRPIGAGLMLVVGLVLVIACANVASMLLARASGRQREIGIRLAIGASRGRLVQQLMTESAVMAALGAAAGAALGWALVRGLTAVRLPIPIPVSFAIGMDARVLLFTLGVTVIAALVAGLMPALSATRSSLAAELKGGVQAGRAAGRRWTLRDTLVASQIAVTLVLLVAAGLLTRSVMAAERIRLGFRTGGLAVVSADMAMIGYDAPREKAFFEQALERVKALPGVESAALVERSPFSINYSRNNTFFPDRDAPDSKGIVLDVTTVSPEYFETFGIPILQGRNFTTADTPGVPKVAIVNETFARTFWPGQSAIGKRFRRQTFDGQEFQIVGVSSDYKVSTVGEAPTPYIHYALAQATGNGSQVVARSAGSAAALLAAMRRELAAMEPNIVFLDSQTMDAQVEATLLPARAGAAGVGAVGIVAMALAAIGLYGVIAYAVARRTREIGIRMALGARPGSVLSLVMRQGLVVALAGVAAGALLAFGAAKAMAGALYGVSPADPVAWLSAVAVLLTVAALANLIPARRAARVNPSRALRGD
ncbi:MAG TPA: ABC transporter permease [Vicinamibacterales bacterium]|nr:ABC transporter permease [Vicinamibacterales bacterium]